jgi:hypothetical protein
MKEARGDVRQFEVARNMLRLCDKGIFVSPRSEFAIRSRAPAIRNRISSHSAGVGEPCSHGYEGVPTGDWTRYWTIREGAITELGCRIAAPTVGCPADRHSAGVFTMRRDANELEPS